MADQGISSMIGAGHRAVPHTARFEAWAPNRDQCLAEAVLALVEGFADTTQASVTGETQIWIDPADDDDQLARLLGQLGIPKVGFLPARHSDSSRMRDSEFTR